MPSFRWALLAALAAACGGPAPPVVEFSGPPGSGEPNLAPTPYGDALLTWIEPGVSAKHALKMSVRSDSAWSPPRTILESDSLFVNWADFPSALMLPNRRLYVHWLAKVPGGKYGYHVRLAPLAATQSSGWITPHRDRSAQEHGFVSMAALDDSSLGMLWLDGQDMVMKDAAHEAEGDMTLRFTTLTSSSLGDEVLLDNRTCECCQTAMARTRSGLVAAYRDRSDKEIRDIAVIRYADGKWSSPIIVGDDNWEFHGCPVNGPALAARGDTVALAWFAAPGGKARVSALLSFDGGATWTASPFIVDDGTPLGRVAVELTSRGAVVVWLEAGARAAVRARQVRFDGRIGKSWEVAPSSEARASGFPRIVRAGDELLFAWTSEQGIRVASQPVKD
jgi:hypothetical protein